MSSDASTDASLSSATNRVFNTYDEADGLRGYITAQPIKTLKDFLQQWSMAEDGWILAHFITCFIALIVYRYLERKLDYQYTIEQILPTQQEMDFMKYDGIGYQPVYTRTELTDALHDAFGFCTSKQIVPIAKMKNFCSKTKK